MKYRKARCLFIIRTDGRKLSHLLIPMEVLEAKCHFFMSLKCVIISFLQHNPLLILFYMSLEIDTKFAIQTTSIAMFSKPVGRGRLEMLVNLLSDCLLESKLGVAAGVSGTPSTPLIPKTGAAEVMTFSVSKTFKALTGMSDEEYARVNVIGGIAANSRHALKSERMMGIATLIAIIVATCLHILLNSSESCDTSETIIDYYSGLDVLHPTEIRALERQLLRNQMEISWPFEGYQSTKKVEKAEDLKILPSNFNCRAPRIWETGSTFDFVEEQDSFIEVARAISNPGTLRISKYLVSLLELPAEYELETSNFYHEFLQFLQSAATQHKIDFALNMLTIERLTFIRFVLTHDYVGSLISVTECVNSVRLQVLEYQLFLPRIIALLKPGFRADVISLLVCGWLFGAFEFRETQETVELLKVLLGSFEKEKCNGENAVFIIVGLLNVEELIVVFQELMRLPQKPLSDVSLLASLCGAITYYLNLNEKALIAHLSEEPTVNKMLTPIGKLMNFVCELLTHIANFVKLTGRSEDAIQVVLSGEATSLYTKICHLAIANDAIPIEVRVELLITVIAQLHYQIKLIAPDCMVPAPTISQLDFLQ